MGISLSGLTESSTGDLTISAGSNNDVLIGNGTTQIFVSGLTDTLGIGGTAVSGSRFNIETGAVALDFITSTGTAINVVTDTVNDTSGAATLALVPTVQVGVMTYTASNAMVYTNAASLYIAGIPVASNAGDGTVTFTNPAYALWVDAGAVRFDDRTFWIGGIAYEFPANNGSVSEFLQTDGSGNLSWSSVASASASTTVTVTDNEAENESNLITFVAGAASTTGNHGLEMDGDFTYSPNTGTVTAINFSGNLTGTLQTAAQGTITSVGTLTDLTVSGTSTTIGTVTSGIWNAGAVTSSGAITGASLVADLTTLDGNTLSTSSGNLAIRAATGSDVLIGDNATILYVNGGLFGGTGGAGIGAVSTTAFFNVDSPAITVGSNADFYKMRIGRNAVTTVGGSTTTPLIAQLRVDKPAITATGTVTESAAVWIEGAATEGGLDYALHVAGGVSRFDGDIQVTNVDPRIRLTDTTSPEAYGEISVFSSTSGGDHVGLDISAVTNANTDPAYIRLFRGTDTSGLTAFQVKIGSATSSSVSGNTTNAQIAGTGDTYFAAHNGNVGIGIAAPEAKLHIYTSNFGSAVNANGDELFIESAGNAGITIASPIGSIYFNDAGSSTAGLIAYRHASTRMEFVTETADSMFLSGGATPTMAFQGATTVSTASGNLTISAATGADVLIGDNDTILYVDGEYGRVGIGQAPGSVFLNVLGGNGTQMTLDNGGEQWNQLNFANNGTDRTFIGLDHSNHYYIFGAQGSYAASNSPHLDSWRFRTGSTERLIIEEDGTGVSLEDAPLLNVGGANNEWTSSHLYHKNNSATNMSAFEIRPISGAGGFNFSPFTEMASGGGHYFIQDFQDVTLTGSNPTTYPMITNARWQGMRYSATNANQIIDRAYTMYLEPPYRRNNAGYNPEIRDAAALYISSGGSTGSNNYAIWVAAGDVLIAGGKASVGIRTIGNTLAVSPHQYSTGQAFRDMHPKVYHIPLAFFLFLQSVQTPVPGWIFP